MATAKSLISDQVIPVDDGREWVITLVGGPHDGDCIVHPHPPRALISEGHLYTPDLDPSGHVTFQTDENFHRIEMRHRGHRDSISRDYLPDLEACIEAAPMFGHTL